MIKGLLIAFILMTGAYADELNLKYGSLVNHKIKYADIDWVEGWSNTAKGIEYIYDTDNKNWGVGLSYINFINSYGVKTIAKGLVVRHRTVITSDFAVHSKVYYVKQKGYYKWQVIGASNDNSNEFWTPMLSVGGNYKGFTVDGLVTDKLSAIVFGYSFRFKGL